MYTQHGLVSASSRRRLVAGDIQVSLRPFLEGQVAQARVVPLPASHVGFDRREIPVRVGLGRVGRRRARQAVRQRVAVAGLPPSRWKLSDGAELTTIRHSRRALLALARDGWGRAVT